MKKVYPLYVLVITQGISLLGSRMSGIAVGIWLFQTEGSASSLLLIPFFNEIVAALMGGIVGVVVDRWKRKYAMLFGDLGQAVGTGLLMLFVMTHHFNVRSIYLVIALQGAFSLFESVAADAATTMMVSACHRDRVNAMKEMMFPLAGIAAPVLAGFLYMSIGIAGVLLIDFATFLVAVVALLVLDIPDPAAGEERINGVRTLLREMGAGFRYLFRRKGLLGLTVYITLINFLLNGPLELVIPYITRLTGSTGMVSVMLGVMNLGAFVGATLLALWKTVAHKVRVLLVGIGFSGVMFLVFGIARMPAVLGVSLFLLMIPLPVMGALIKSIIQMKTPPNVQGRVFASIAQISNLVVPMSFVLTGPLVDNILEPALNSPAWTYAQPLFGSHAGSGMGLLLACTGIVILAITLIAALCPVIRQAESQLPDQEADDVEKSSF